MSRRTLEQERAFFCLEKLKEIKDSNNNSKINNYKRNAKRLSSLIITNGLIATLAFYKSKEEALDVYHTLSEWLEKKGFIKNDPLIELINSDFQTLRLATIEALSIANWLKRMVEVEL